MKYINSLLKRVNRITPKIDLRDLMIFLDEIEGKYYDKEGKEFVIPKEDDGHIYVTFISSRRG